MPDLARKVKADSGDSGVGSKKVEQPRWWRDCAADAR